MTKYCDDEGCEFHGTLHVCHGEEFKKFITMAYVHYHALLTNNGLTPLGTPTEQYAVYLLAARYEDHDARVSELLAANALEVERRRTAELNAARLSFFLNIALAHFGVPK